jgi:hypothetical protein
MSVIRLFVIGAAAFLLTGCEGFNSGGAQPARPGPSRTPPSSATVPFRASDFAWSTSAGKNAIRGHLIYRTPSQRFTCAGAAVVLTPETPWTRRRMTILYNSPTAAALPVDQVRARTPSAPNNDYSAFVKRTTCDSSDRFGFAGLPNGSWFVITVAKPATGSAASVAIMRRVETKGGKVIPLDL